MGATQDTLTTKKNGVSMILDSRKGNNTSMMLYLEKKRYAPEGQLGLINLPEEKKYYNEKIIMAQ